MMGSLVLAYLLLYSVVVVAAESLSQIEEEAECVAGDNTKKSSPPGLYTALDKNVTPSPEELRRTVCK